MISQVAPRFSGTSFLNRSVVEHYLTNNTRGVNVGTLQNLPGFYGWDNDAFYYQNGTTNPAPGTVAITDKDDLAVKAFAEQMMHDLGKPNNLPQALFQTPFIVDLRTDKLIMAGLKANEQWGTFNVTA